MRPSAPANLETYRVSSLSNTNSQNSEMEASMEMNNLHSSHSSISDGMGFRIIGSIETDQKKLAEVQDENKVLKRQLKREQREVERLKRIVAGNRNEGHPQHFLAPEGERLSGSTERTYRQGNIIGSLSRVTFFDETKSGSLRIGEADVDSNVSPPTPKRRLSDRDSVSESLNFAGLSELSNPIIDIVSEEINEDDTSDDENDAHDHDGASYEESVKGPPDDHMMDTASWNV